MKTMTSQHRIQNREDSSRALGRRQFIGLAASCGVAACSNLIVADAAAATRSLTIAFGWVPNAEYADVFVAIDKQHFAHAGLTVNYLGGGPNAPVSLVLVAAGQADIAATSWLQLLDAEAHGNDFVIIASMIPVAPEGLISLPRRPVLKPADLPGKRFLVQGPAERNVLDAVFKINHLPPNHQYIPAGYSPDALLAGAGDAYFCFVTNQPVIFEDMNLKEGKDFLVARMDQFGYHVPSQLFVVDRRKLVAERAVFVAFLHGLLQGYIDNKKDPPYGAGLVVSKFGRDYGFSLHQQTRLNQLQLPLERAPGTPGPYWITEEQLRGSMYDVARATGRANLPDPARIMDMSLLAEAYKGLSL
ncbi:MAG TPA: ABC transporter substrate-binding protein [Candidatus Acidoferrum sp.]|nr:ABC transporter substrate-binding protein [Candidatus Acidoferrum sp.]